VEVYGMSILKKFNQIFGLGNGVREERKRFVERVNHLVFHEIDTEKTNEYCYMGLFDLVCVELGVNPYKFSQRLMTRADADVHLPPPIRTLTKDNFIKTLQVLCIIHSYIEYDGDSKKGQKNLTESIDLALSLCSCDIGIRWKEGFFHPVGAEELDKPLIEGTLTWLKDYANERKDYERALQNFSEGGKSLGDVIKNCYSAVEGVVRNVLGNDRTLNNNKDELLKQMNLSDGWKSIMATYIKYAHDYRHASPERHKITKQEAEAYLYMTGLIIRLTIESK
jgi:hypothetical protein